VLILIRLNLIKDWRWRFDDDAIFLAILIRFPWQWRFSCLAIILLLLFIFHNFSVRQRWFKLIAGRCHLTFIPRLTVTNPGATFFTDAEFGPRFAAHPRRIYVTWTFSLCLNGFLGVHSLIFRRYRRYCILIPWASYYSFALLVREGINWGTWLLIGHEVIRKKLHQLLIIHSLLEKWGFFVYF